MTSPMSDLEQIKTLGLCSPPCAARLMAIVENEFGPARVLGGWVFREGPFRRMSDEARWASKWFGDAEPEDHTGEHYVHVCCPWCGRDLPIPPDDEGLEAIDDG